MKQIDKKLFNRTVSLMIIIGISTTIYGILSDYQSPVVRIFSIIIGLFITINIILIKRKIQHRNLYMS